VTSEINITYRAPTSLIHTNVLYIGQVEEECMYVLKDSLLQNQRVLIAKHLGKVWL